jgi:hypothetical protein
VQLACQHESAVTAQDLESLDWSFASDGRRDLTHNVHPWAAKFIPQIPAAVIEACTVPGERVLDPFAGCGTTALEALRAGRTASVADVNPLAILITEGKCFPPRAHQRRAIRAWAESLEAVDQSPDLLRSAPEIPNGDYWFDSAVVAQLAYLRDEINGLEISSAFLKTVFSSIIVAVSRQESETRYRRVDRPHTASEVLERFRTRLTKALIMAKEFERVIPRGHPDPQILCRDARDLKGLESDKPCDLAVFSPPYPNAFDYHLYHRFRLFWLGYDPRLVKRVEIGAHLRYLGAAEWEADMAQSLREVVRLLRPNARCVIVVGDGIVKGGIVPSGDLLWSVAPTVGLEQEWRGVRALPRHRRAFNLADTRLRKEEILVFRR